MPRLRTTELDDEADADGVETERAPRAAADAGAAPESEPEAASDPVGDEADLLDADADDADPFGGVGGAGDELDASETDDVLADLEETIAVLEEAELVPLGALDFSGRSIDRLERVTLALLREPAESPLTAEGLLEFAATYFLEAASRELGLESRVELRPESPAFGLAVLPAPVEGEPELTLCPLRLVADLAEHKRRGFLRDAWRALPRRR